MDGVDCLKKNNLMVSLEMVRRLQRCIQKEQHVQVETNMGESIHQHTKMMLKRDHTAEADSTYRRKSLQRISTMFICSKKSVC